LDTRNTGGLTDQQICNGTLIDPDSVLTAGRCVVGMSADKSLTVSDIYKALGIARRTFDRYLNAGN
jgi:V8-like Glu-specific endopeptidase